MKKPLSLLQHFDAPQQYRGVFGWVCGYSADALFMDMALEHFSRLTRGQRASSGRPLLALMTDPEHPPISMLDAPGVAHLPWQRGRTRPFRLQHAKVAILGFRHETEVERWRVRLIISTGNWTQQTVEESLDMVFRLDVDSTELVAKQEKTLPQTCADVAVAWDVVRWLREHYDMRLLHARRAEDRVSLTHQSMEMLNGWLDSIRTLRADAAPRVFHNRKRSLLSQLPELVQKHAGDSTRNYLAIGSGFYEGGESSDKVPSVLQAIRDDLARHRLMRRNPTIDVVINPDACQVISHARKTIEASGYTLRPPAQSADIFSSNVKRTLHAKFLFGATHSDRDSSCGEPWLYLGSGNLTSPGFANTMSETGGNLEVGVVFAPGKLERKRDASAPETYLGNCLPFDPEGPSLDVQLPLHYGGDMPERQATHVSPPVAWLVWCEGKLCTPDPDDVDWCVLLPDDKAAPALTPGVFEWQGERPRQVRIGWPATTREHHADIPVLDELGRLAATDLLPMEIDDAIWQLMSFPAHPPEELGGDDSDEGEDDARDRSGSSTREAGIYEQPIRKMMMLIEEIANHQTNVSQVDWLAWCTRLEQTLYQLQSNPNIVMFKSLGLNPLSPLRHPPFRPIYAEDGTSTEGRDYQAMLSRIEAAWGVCDLRDLGDAS